MQGYLYAVDIVSTPVQNMLSRRPPQTRPLIHITGCPCRMPSVLVQFIAEVLAQLDPAAQADYQQRAMAYQEQLRSADGEIRRLLADPTA